MRATPFIHLSRHQQTEEVTAFYLQPFKPEMIIEHFEGWEFDSDESEFLDQVGFIREVYHSDKDLGADITFSIDEYMVLGVGYSNGIDFDSNEFVFDFIPRILNDFISDCTRAGIELIWKQSIVDKYFPDYSGLIEVLKGFKKGGRYDFNRP